MKQLVRGLVAAVATALALLPAVCPGPAAAQTAPSPGVPFVPPPAANASPGASTPASAKEVPATWPTEGRIVSLSEAVDFALRTSPATRASWFNARAAAEGVGSRLAAYYPFAELDANVTRQKQVAQGGRVESLLTSWGPSASLTWLLLDLGGRSADVDEARRALDVANTTQNAVIQAVVLEVQTAFYGFQSARSLLEAAVASLRDAETNLTAAEERHRAGVATIADVLQAKTARSSAVLTLETARGAIAVQRGALATSLGVPANVPIDVEPLPADVAVEDVGQAIEPFIAKALADRPDLQAVRAAADRAEARVRSVRSSALPNLSTSGFVGRSYFGDTTYASFGDSYSIALLFRWPVFTGFQKEHDLRQAKETASAAREQALDAEQRAVLDVWTSYHDVKTATQRVRAARDLLESATQSEEVNEGRYKAGVGSILDVLASQASLASARAQDVLARTDWLLSIARLARATGTLGPQPGNAPPAAATDSKETR